MQINFEKVFRSVYNFPRGVSPLYAGLKPEVLASRKLVTGDGGSEGSETAKSGTDEQKLHTRLYREGKQAHHCNAQKL